MRSNIATALLALCALLLGSPAGAEPIARAGMTFTLPDGWREQGVAWERESPRGERLTLAAAAVKGPLWAGEVAPAQARAWIEDALRRRGLAAVRVDEVRAGRVDGAAAFSVRATVEAGSGRLQETLVAISGRDTLILGVTSSPADAAAACAQLDQVIRSVRVEARPAPWEEPPAPLCGAFLGLVALLSCALWRRRSCSSSR